MLPVTVGKIESAVALFPAGVQWKKSTAGNPNIISVISNGSIQNCRDTNDPKDRTRNAIYFYDDFWFEKICGKPPYGPDRASACWTSDNSSMIEEVPQSIVLAASLNWSNMQSCGTTFLEQVLLHEVGHAFGLGHSPMASSLMYEETVVCGLTAYDIGATMANYQSR